MGQPVWSGAAGSRSTMTQIGIGRPSTPRTCRHLHTRSARRGAPSRSTCTHPCGPNTRVSVSPERGVAPCYRRVARSASGPRPKSTSTTAWSSTASMQRARGSSRSVRPTNRRYGPTRRPDAREQPPGSRRNSCPGSEQNTQKDAKSPSQAPQWRPADVLTHVWRRASSGRC